MEMNVCDVIKTGPVNFNLHLNLVIRLVSLLGSPNVQNDAENIHKISLENIRTSAKRFPAPVFVENFSYFTHYSHLTFY